MNRRELLKLGASVAVVPAAGVAQRQDHAAAGATAKPEAVWKPELFDDHANETVIALIETVDAGADPELVPGHRFFQMLKGMTAEIYYATEAGFRELNKGGRVPSAFACRHPEHA